MSNKTYFLAKMIEHKDGTVEFRFYNNNMKLIRQRRADKMEFQEFCNKQVDELNKKIERSIFDGTCPVLVGPKVITN